MRIEKRDWLVACLIMIITFGYFLDRYIPEGLIELDLKLFKIGSFGFEDFSYLIYSSKMKFLIIAYCLIWYFNTKHWWRTAILIIVLIECIKLASIFNSKKLNYDETEYLTSLPVTIPIVFLLVFTVLKLHNFRNIMGLLREIDGEIDLIFFNINSNEKSKIKKMKEKINEIKTSEKVRELRLKRLIELRDEFYKK